MLSWDIIARIESASCQVEELSRRELAREGQVKREGRAFSYEEF